MMRNPEVQIGNSGQARAYSAAVPSLEKAVKVVPSNRACRYHPGLTNQKLQNPSRAKAELEKGDSKSLVADQARQAIGQNPVS